MFNFLVKQHFSYPKMYSRSGVDFYFWCVMPGTHRTTPSQSKKNFFNLELWFSYWKYVWQCNYRVIQSNWLEILVVLVWQILSILSLQIYTSGKILLFNIYLVLNRYSNRRAKFIQFEKGYFHESSIYERWYVGALQQLRYWILVSNPPASYLYDKPQAKIKQFSDFLHNEFIILCNIHCLVSLIRARDFKFL